MSPSYNAGMGVHDAKRLFTAELETPNDPGDK